MEQLAVRRLRLYPVFVALLVALVGAFVAIIAVGPVNSFASRGVMYLLVSILGLLVFVPILHRIIKHSFDLAEPGIWFALFYFSHFGLRAIYDLMFGSPILGFGAESVDFSLLNVALGVSIIGLLMFWIGYHFRIGQAIAHSLPSMPKRWESHFVLPVTIICAAVGWGLRFYLIIYIAGSINRWLFTSKDLLLAPVTGIMYIEIFSAMATVALFSLFISARVSHRKTYWLIFLLLLLPELAYRLVSGSRAQLGLLILSLLIAYYMTSERGYKVNKRLLGWAGIGILLLALLFPVLSAIRFGGLQSAIRGISTTAKLAESPWQLFGVVGHRLHDLDSLALIISRVPDQVPYTLGSELSLIGVAWIPRAIWPAKPTISIGRIFNKLFVPPGLYGSTASVSVSLPGEFYWDLGVLGVVIGMIFVGIVWRFLHEYLVRPKGVLSNALIASVMFPSFFIPLEQTIVSLFTMHFPTFIMVCMVALIIGSKKRYGKEWA